MKASLPMEAELRNSLSNSGQKGVLAVLVIITSFWAFGIAGGDEIGIKEALYLFYKNNYDIVKNKYEIDKASADLLEAKLRLNPNLSLLETIKDKFRPVFMSGIVASLGLLPVSLAHGVGSQVQKPLAIVVVGGMLIGTSLQLFIIPLLLRFISVEPKLVRKYGAELVDD